MTAAMLRPGWQAAPHPADEAARLAALQDLAVLDTPPEPEFDALVQAASIICGTPVSLISLVDAQRQWFKANHGLPGVHETPREQAFCAHAILQDGLFVVADTLRDDRFAGNPLVTAEAGIRFYAGAPLRLHDGQVAGTLCVIDHQPRQLDAAQRQALTCLALAAARALEGRHAGMALAQRNAFLDTTLSAIADAVLTTDAAGQLTWMNPAAETLLGRPGTDLRGVSVDEMLPLRTASPGTGWQAFLAAANRGERTQLPPDAVLDSPRTGPLAIEGSVSPLRAAGRPPPADPATACADPSAGAVLVLRDTTEARRASSEVLHRATHDALTGLVNRAEFERRLRQLLATAHAGHAHHCALLIDLDQFKIVNDSCGHAAGDRLLQQVARMLQASVRSSDTVARMGGDEFAVLLLNCPQAASMAMAQKICDRLEGLRFATDGKRFQVGPASGWRPWVARWATARP